MIRVEKEESARVGIREEIKGFYGWGRENRKDERVEMIKESKYEQIRLKFVRSEYMGNG